MRHDHPPIAPGAVLDAILAQRTRQIVDFGHTPEQDARLPAAHLPKQARAYLEGAIDELMFQKPGWLNRAHLKLAKGAALTIAAMERLEREND